jgi:hypothetical protein
MGNSGLERLKAGELVSSKLDFVAGAPWVLD